MSLGPPRDYRVQDGDLCAETDKRYPMPGEAASPMSNEELAETRFGAENPPSSILIAGNGMDDTEDRCR